MDVEEVSLSFLRSGNESSMPTLRSFIQITDWPLVERLFEVAGRPVEGRPGRAGHRFAKDLKFRIPGGPSRSYLTARETVIFLAEDEDEEVAGVCAMCCACAVLDQAQPTGWVGHLFYRSLAGAPVMV